MRSVKIAFVLTSLQMKKMNIYDIVRARTILVDFSIISSFMDRGEICCSVGFKVRCRGSAHKTEQVRCCAALNFGVRL